MEKIISLSYELKNLLDTDLRVIDCSKKEQAMSNDPLAMSMSYKKDLAIDEYEFALNHFKKESKEVEIAQKKLHEAKLALDSVPSVQEYLKSYSKVRDLYLEINDILFSFMNRHICKGKH